MEFCTADADDPQAVGKLKKECSDYRKKFQRECRGYDRQAILRLIRETIPETCDEKDAASLLYANELGEFYLMKAEDVLPTAAADFEGLSVSVPKNPDACLRRIYGDNYMGYPPDGFPHHGKDGAGLAEWAGNSGTDMQEVIRTLESIYQNL